MKKKLKLVLAIFAILIFLSGCKSNEVLNNIKQSLEDLIPKEDEKIKIVDLESTSRPFAVMINNHKNARPYHSGLQDAYIIYEIIVEGGITRYLALFHDTNTERIGSVRSARHYFLDYALENDAIYIHHGQSPQALTDFSKLGIHRIAVDFPNTAWRDTSLNTSHEHTLFTSIEKIKNGIGNIRLERNVDFLLNYSIDEVDLSNMEGAQKANTVTIKYSNILINQYEYDEKEKVYKHSINDVVHKDYITGKQYTFKNIIVIPVSNYTIDSYGRQDINNIGEFEGYYITNGYAVPIIAKKDSRSAQTVYQYLDGTEIDVNDGNTFIHIQPKGQNLIFE